MSRIFMICLLSIAASAALAESTAAKYVWDLSSLFPDDAAWEKERAALRQHADQDPQIVVDPSRPESIASALDAMADLRIRSGKLVVYSLLRSMEDTRDAAAQARYDGALALESRVEARLLEAEGRTAALGSARLSELMAADARIARHRRRITAILRDADHQPAPLTGDLLGAARRSRTGFAAAYRALMEADLPWPVIDVSGVSTRIDPAAAARLRSSADAAVRDDAARAYFSFLRRFEDVAATLLVNRIAADDAAAAARRFHDGHEALFHSEGMPAATRETLIAAARRAAPAVARALSIRRAALSLTRLSYNDIALAVPPWTREIPVEEAFHSIVAASEPLGRPYQALLESRLQQPWFHLAPTPSKRAEYGIWYSVGGANPYAFMIYNGTAVNAAGLAGLATLMMSYANVPHDAPADSRFDPGIYSNALIYAGRALFTDYLAANARTGNERVAARLLAVNDLLRQFVRHAMTVEFETIVQRRIAAGQSCTGAELSEIYLRLVREYYPGIAVDDYFAAEWIATPLPFHSYETANWPVAMSAACLLLERLRDGDARARRGFSGVLGFGASDASYDLLREAGVDLATSAPYDAATRRLSSLLDSLQKELEPRPAVR